MSHQTISFIKSGIRILGFGLLFGITFEPLGNLFTIREAFFLGFGAQILAEVVGIFEEVGQ